MILFLVLIVLLALIVAFSVWRAQQRLERLVARLRSSQLHDSAPQDECAQLFVGLALGDAVGAGIEMASRSLVRELLTVDRDEARLTEYINIRTHQYAVNYWSGRYTDDAEHSLAVAKLLTEQWSSLADVKASDACARLLALFAAEWQPRQWQQAMQLVHNVCWLMCGRCWRSQVSWREALYKAWFEGRQGHGSILRYFRGINTIEQVRQSQTKKSRPGNAPPMRATPLGWIADKDVRWKYSCIIADCTHPHPLARCAAFVVATACHLIVLQKQPRANIIQLCLEELRDVVPAAEKQACEPMFRTMQLVDQQKSFHDLGGIDKAPFEKLLDGDARWGKRNIKGLPVDSLLTATTALYILKHCISTFDGLQSSLLVGGDVDSLASIVTGIMAGRYGMADIPTKFFEELEDVEYIYETSQAFHASTLI